MIELTVENVFFAVAGVVGAVSAFLFFRKRRRRTAAKSVYVDAPFPEKWAKILRRRLPVYTRLPEDVRERLHRKIKIFLAEKTFSACGGLRSVDDSAAVTIAGHACLLLAGRDATECFPTVNSVLVYPDSFYAKTRDVFSDSGAEIVSEVEHAGEASAHGNVVLSWREILQNNAFAGNGRNVVAHEFAHHVLPEGGALPAALAGGLASLRAGGINEVIDEYGAQNPEEFWAVSVEAFFENPVRFETLHPALYDAMREFFGMNPAAWRENSLRLIRE